MKKVLLTASLMFVISIIISCNGTDHAQTTSIDETETPVTVVTPKAENLEFTPMAFSLSEITKEKFTGEGGSTTETSYQILITPGYKDGKEKKFDNAITVIAMDDSITGTKRGNQLLKNYNLLKEAQAKDILIEYQKQDALYVPIKVTIKEIIFRESQGGKAGSFKPAVVVYQP